MTDIIFIIYLVFLVIYCFMCGSRTLQDRARFLWAYYFQDFEQWNII